MNQMRTLLLAAAGVALLTGPALANPCAAEIKAVDAALLSAKLAPADMKKVQDLKAQGEKAVKDNKTADCLKAMGEAKKLLGVK
jgi:hypothetical protein